MKQQRDIMIVTHVYFRDENTVSEGPFSSVGNALNSLKFDVRSLQLPLLGTTDKFLYGPWKKEKIVSLNPIFGKSLLIKFFTDIVLSTWFTFRFMQKKTADKKIIVAIDPLTCLPLLLLKHLFGFTLIFYCVDFNTHRFTNTWLQYCYAKADELCSVYADETWVVSQHLQNYKKRVYKSSSVYIPNSSTFSSDLYKKYKDTRTGNKLVWGGSCITDKQMKDLFIVLSKIQKEQRQDLSIYLAPVDKYDVYEKQSKKYHLQNVQVLRLHKNDWLELVAKSDVGIAVYDPSFGSTEFIEPLKIWDFMKCGLPFIISCEPPISQELSTSGVAFQLQSKNTLPKDDSLRTFLQADNLIKKQEKSISLAKKYDMKKLIDTTLKKFTG